MEQLQRGGRSVPGFGVGIAPQSAFVKTSDQGGGGSLLARPTGKVGAFLGGAVMSGLAGVAATTFFGEGTNVGGIGAITSRLQRNWKVLAATAVAGGVVGAVSK